MELIISVLFVIIVSTIKSFIGESSIGDDDYVDTSAVCGGTNRVSSTIVGVDLQVGNNVFMQRDTSAFMYYVKLLKLR